MIEIRSEIYEGWTAEVGVERNTTNPFPGTFKIDHQYIRNSPHGANANVAHDTHVGGPFASPEIAFAKGFEACRRDIDLILGKRKKVDND